MQVRWYEGAAASLAAHLCNVVKKPHYKVRLSGAARADIVWWLEFAKTFNGSANIIKPIGTHL